MKGSIPVPVWVFYATFIVIMIFELIGNKGVPTEKFYWMLGLVGIFCGAWLSFNARKLQYMEEGIFLMFLWVAVFLIYVGALIGRFIYLGLQPL